MVFKESILSSYVSVFGIRVHVQIQCNNNFTFLAVLITGMFILMCLALVGMGYIGLGGTYYITMSCSLCGLGEGHYV